MKRLALGIAAVLFGIFLLNVTFGALRRPVFLNDVQEMLTLFCSVLAFVVAVLAIERDARSAGRDARADAAPDVPS